MALYLASSASAEFFADMFLAPFEAMKVRIQTMPGYARNMREAYAKMSKEGGNPFFKGIKPLWMRQIPYTMMKFSCFEKTVELLYANVVPKPRAECSKSEQLVVTFAAGFIAGVFCAIVAPSRLRRVRAQQDPRLHRRRGPQGSRLEGLLGWSWPTYHHDWYSHCSPMVHLRLGQGRPPNPPTAPTDHARKHEAATRGGRQAVSWQRQIRDLFEEENRTSSLMLQYLFLQCLNYFYKLKLNSEKKFDSGSAA